MNNATTQQIRELAGTEVKLSVSIAASGLSMDDYDFECEFYPRRTGVENRRRALRKRKEDMVRVDGTSYIAVVDTAVTGPGELMCRTTAWIPDGHCDDGLRTEIQTAFTGVTLR